MTVFVSLKISSPYCIASVIGSSGSNSDVGVISGSPLVPPSLPSASLSLAAWQLTNIKTKKTINNIPSHFLIIHYLLCFFFLHLVYLVTEKYVIVFKPYLKTRHTLVKQL